MLILSADTSGKHGSIALAQGQPDGTCRVLEVVCLDSGTFSDQLIPQLAALLTKCGFSTQDIGAFAVTSGPGSFTGLRVGLAAIKALAEVLHKPIAPVSLLEALATAGRFRGKVLAALDAGRGEIYAGKYQLDDTTTMLSERLLTQQEVLADADRSTIITPDPTIATMARAAGLPVEEVHRPGSEAVAHLGWKKILAGATVTPEALDANYIRRTSAEIFSTPNH